MVMIVVLLMSLMLSLELLMMVLMQQLIVLYSNQILQPLIHQFKSVAIGEVTVDLTVHTVVLI